LFFFFVFNFQIVSYVTILSVYKGIILKIIKTNWILKSKRIYFYFKIK